MKQKILQILKESRELLSDPQRWTQGYEARDHYGIRADPCSNEAVCWCLFGALSRSCTKLGFDEENDGTFWKTYDAVYHKTKQSVAVFNDFSERTHAEILQILDDVILDQA